MSFRQEILFNFKENCHVRSDQRKYDEIRPMSFTPDYQLHPTGSVLVSCGKTRILCAATVTDGVPRWMREQKVAGGWITAEYRMLPGSSQDRIRRDSGRGPSGRTHEIQRLIGRSIRAVVDMKKLPPITVQIDCDVIDADGGTRCASITGASVAVEIALRKLFAKGALTHWPMKEHVGAVSAGIVEGECILDLCYVEDSGAEVDMNVVMTESGNLVEVQGTAEGAPFSIDQMNEMVSLSANGLKDIFRLQKEAVKKAIENL